ncbi:hypothetical protein BGZ95_002416 [Linnemannia exigua]|uniref:F-box domain-containing protein n=1 Tax=Linnemannia exigua TaxID=604196 RepID=A0AAD4H9G8_9FUNG|nr:hypothetical protein BGZ95_002416 [Linnemannia exigua]
MSSSHNLLLLPAEILLHIGQHLDRQSLYASIQTSTLLYNTYTPLLWRHITLDDASEHQVRFKALQARVDHVYDLALKTFLPSHYTLAFPRLVSLSLLNEYSFLGAQAFVKRNPTIKDLLIIDRQSLPTKEFWEAVYSQWYQPRTLTVQELNVPERAAGAFWKACSRFEILHLVLHAPPTSLPKDLSFPLVTRLNLKLDHLRSEPFPPEEQLALIKACPSLTSLCWSLDHFESPMLQFQEALAQQTWTQLTDLELRGSTHLDADMAAVMDSLAPLGRLVLSGCSFGPLTFSKLKERHFMSLEVLDVVECEGFTSAMAVEVLSRCPHLQEFRCPHIQLKDLVQEQQQDQEQHQKQEQSFACQQYLKRLDTFISKNETDPTDWTDKALERLSTLTQLEYLSLYPGQPDSECQTQIQEQQHSISNHNGSILDICLETGLDRLSSLSRLQFFGFGDSSLRMGLEEAQWIVQSWKQLKTVMGNFSSVDGYSMDQEEKVAVMFEQRGITHLKTQSNIK